MEVDSLPNWEGQGSPECSELQLRDQSPGVLWSLLSPVATALLADLHKALERENVNFDRA